MVFRVIQEIAQRAFCEEIGFDADELLDSSCWTPERYIYVTGIDQEVYRSDHWLEPIEGEELEERREAYLQRGLDVDGRPLAGAAVPLPSRGGVRGGGCNSAASKGPVNNDNTVPNPSPTGGGE